MTFIDWHEIWAAANWKSINAYVDWSATASFISALVAIAALWYSHQQWKKVGAKIAMISASGRATEVLPAWYTERMMNDYWLFGLLTNAGHVVVIRRILAISDDCHWMDVELVEADELPGYIEKYGKPVSAVHSERTKASLRIDSIVAAIDLQAS